MAIKVKSVKRPTLRSLLIENKKLKEELQNTFELAEGYRTSLLGALNTNDNRERERIKTEGQAKQDLLVGIVNVLAEKIVGKRVANFNINWQ